MNYSGFEQVAGCVELNDLTNDINNLNYPHAISQWGASLRLQLNWMCIPMSQRLTSFPERCLLLFILGLLGGVSQSLSLVLQLHGPLSITASWPEFLYWTRWHGPRDWCLRVFSCPRRTQCSLLCPCTRRTPAKRSIPIGHPLSRHLPW